LGGIAFAAGTVLGQNVFGGSDGDTNGREKRSAVFPMMEEGERFLLLFNDSSNGARIKRSILFPPLSPLPPIDSWYFMRMNLTTLVGDLLEEHAKFLLSIPNDPVSLPLESLIGENNGATVSGIVVCLLYELLVVYYPLAFLARPRRSLKLPPIKLPMTGLPTISMA
jgi:hypothetical protein